MTGATGEVLKVTPHHLQFGNGPKHAYYDVEWSNSSSSTNYNDKTTMADLLRNAGDRLADVDRYTTYEVTIRLAGKQRVYRAIGFHHSQVASNGKTKTEILDNITREMNTVLADESPRVRSPWAKYIKTGSHLAVAKQIQKAERAGRPLIPAGAPIGYLPGDDVAPTLRDAQITLAATCVVPRVSISGPQAIMDGSTASFSVDSPDAPPISYDWSFTAPAGAGNNPNVIFSPNGQSNTSTNGRWFALPDQECPATNCQSQYNVSCTVGFSLGWNFTVTVATTLTVSGCWIPAGIVDPNEADISGGPEIGRSVSDGLWHVIGMGTLARKIPHKQVLVPQLSQFFAKADAHEQEHLNHWNFGNLFGNLFIPGDFYVRIQNLTGISDQDLINKLIDEKTRYVNEQSAFINANIGTSEQLAFQVSDPLAPRYLYQNCGRY